MPEHSEAVQICHGPFGFRAGFPLALLSFATSVELLKGVRVEIPLQAYFRINAQNMGQFERTGVVDYYRRSWFLCPLC